MNQAANKYLGAETGISAEGQLDSCHPEFTESSFVQTICNSMSEVAIDGQPFPLCPGSSTLLIALPVKQLCCLCGSLGAMGSWIREADLGILAGPPWGKLGCVW